jgi:hypothetical protein
MSLSKNYEGRAIPFRKGPALTSLKKQRALGLTTEGPFPIGAVPALNQSSLDSPHTDYFRIG